MSSCVDVWMHRSSFSFPRGFLYLPRGKKRREREAYGLGKSTLALCYVTRKTYSLCIHTHTHVLFGTSRHLSTLCALELFFIFHSTICSPSWMNINYSNNSAVHCESFVSLASLNTLNMSRTSLGHTSPQNQKTKIRYYILWRAIKIFCIVTLFFLTVKHIFLSKSHYRNAKIKHFCNLLILKWRKKY